jgi:septal ring factor EnvC (AmiA/AmiB activator)
LRIVPVLGVTAEPSGAPMTASQASLTQLFDELRRVRQDLEQAQDERDSLRRELKGAKEALSWAQDELSGREYGLQSWPLGLAADVETQRQERVRIASKLDEARKLAGRRSWFGLTVMS